MSEKAQQEEIKQNSAPRLEAGGLGANIGHRKAKTELRVDSFVESEDGDTSLLASVQEEDSLVSSYKMANSSVAKSSEEGTYYIEDSSGDDDDDSDDSDESDDGSDSEYELEDSYDEEVAQ